MTSGRVAPCSLMAPVLESANCGAGGGRNEDGLLELRGGDAGAGRRSVAAAPAGAPPHLQPDVPDAGLADGQLRNAALKREVHHLQAAGRARGAA
jgi:hypothetical protein